MTTRIRGIARDFVVQTELLDNKVKIDELENLITFVAIRAVIKYADKTNASTDLSDLKKHMLKAEKHCTFYNRVFDEAVSNSRAFDEDDFN